MYSLYTPPPPPPVQCREWVHVMSGEGASGADVQVEGESVDERWEPTYRRQLRREIREFIDDTRSEWAREFPFIKLERPSWYRAVAGDVTTV